MEIYEIWFNWNYLSVDCTFSVQGILLGTISGIKNNQNA